MATASGSLRPNPTDHNAPVTTPLSGWKLTLTLHSADSESVMLT